MLHGVGGRTIAEAKERLSYDEFLAWIAYVKKRGSLNVGMRIEAGAALVTYAVARTSGDKTAEIRKFMPHADEPANEASIGDVFAMLKAKARK